MPTTTRQDERAGKQGWLFVMWLARNITCIINLLNPLEFQRLFTSSTPLPPSSSGPDRILLDPSYQTQLPRCLWPTYAHEDLATEATPSPGSFAAGSAVHAATNSLHSPLARLDSCRACSCVLHQHHETRRRCSLNHVASHQFTAFRRHRKSSERRERLPLDLETVARFHGLTRRQR